MPLPNAKPEPAGSNVYRQLNSIKLGDLTNEQFDIVYQNVFLNDISEDELRRLALVGAARQSFSASSSGPIPGTMQVIRQASTSSGTIFDAFQPAKGEVWQLVGAISTSGTGFSGTVFLEIKLYDTVNAQVAEIISTSTTSGTEVPMTEITQNPTFIDENIILQVEASGTFTQCDFKIPLIRVR